jgi:hypothetical protein
MSCVADSCRQHVFAASAVAAGRLSLVQGVQLDCSMAVAPAVTLL